MWAQDSFDNIDDDTRPSPLVGRDSPEVLPVPLLVVSEQIPSAFSVKSQIFSCIKITVF
jgi:hypothetical protein